MEPRKNSTCSKTSFQNFDEVLALKSYDLLQCKKLAQAEGQMLLSMLQKRPKW